MARTFTPTERGYISAAHTHHAIKFEVSNYNGTWKDMTSWLLHATLEDDVDTNTLMLNATLQRDDGALASLAPLRTDSTLNVDDAAAYQPLLDPARQWRLSVAVVSFGTTITSGHYKEVGAGVYDVVDVTHPSPVVQITGRDYGASLLDKYIDVERTYGDDASPVAMEDVIQQVLDDNLGLAAVTLYTPTSPVFVLKKFTLKDLSVMQAVNLIAQKAGFVCRYRYDASDVQRLTLYVPDRSAAPGAEVWTLDPSEYTNLPSARLDIAGVRNKIVVAYYDLAAGKVSEVTATDATSVTRYGGPHAIPRILRIDVSPDTNIQTSARAQALADAVLSDLETPALEQQVEVPGFWIAQLGDYGKFNANAVHYNSAQYGGVTRIRHSFERGTMKTTLNVRGQPQGRYRTWVADSRIQGVPELRIANFRETDRSTTEVTYGWEVEGLAHQLWLWLDTLAQPITGEPWQSLDSQPDVRLTNTTTSYTVEIPAVGYTTYGQLVPVDANGVMGNPWQFTLQGELIRLIQQASVIAQSATQTTVRVRVANPLAGGNITVTAAATGCTIDTSSQTILSGVVTTSLDTTGYVDFVITRPAFQAGTGRVVFTATATDRIADVDAVDVPAQERDTLYVECVARITATTATTVTVTVTASALSGTPTVGYVGVTGSATLSSGNAAGTYTYAQNGTDNVWVFNRGAFQAGVGQAQFRAVLTGYQSDDDLVTIEEQGRDTIGLLVRAKAQTVSATQVVARVAVADPVAQSGQDVTLTYTVVGATINTPASPQTILSANVTTSLDTTGTVDVTLDRAAFGSGTGRVTFTATRANRAADSDSLEIPSLDRDTQPVSVRIEPVSTSATQLVLRVKAITPNAGATCTVSYSSSLTVSPASGGTFASTTSFGTTNYIDYTITRPVQGSDPVRLAFTVSATGFVDGTDGVDVLPQFDRFRCLLGKNTAQAITGSTWTAVTWQVETVDNGGLHDTGSNTSRITIPTNGNVGFWIFNAGGIFTNPGGGGTPPTLVQFDLYKNGSTVLPSPIARTYTNTNADALSLTKMVAAPSVGDYYELYAHHDGSGGNWGLDSCFFEAIHVH